MMHIPIQGTDRHGSFACVNGLFSPCIFLNSLSSTTLNIKCLSYSALRRKCCSLSCSSPCTWICSQVASGNLKIFSKLLCHNICPRKDHYKWQLLWMLVACCDGWYCLIMPFMMGCFSVVPDFASSCALMIRKSGEAFLSFLCTASSRTWLQEECLRIVTLSRNESKKLAAARDLLFNLLWEIKIFNLITIILAFK